MQHCRITQTSQRDVRPLFVEWTFLCRYMLRCGVGCPRATGWTTVAGTKATNDDNAAEDDELKAEERLKLQTLRGL